MEAVKNLIIIDPEILGGQPVFKGTRVPVDSLFMHLEQGISLNEFLDEFPTVSREQAVGVLELAEKLVTSKNIEKLYEDLIVKLTQSINEKSEDDHDFSSCFGAWDDERSSDEIIDDIRNSRVNSRDIEDF